MGLRFSVPFFRPGCAEIKLKSCDAGAVAVQSPQIPHRNRTVLVWTLYRGPAEIVCGLCEGRTITVQFLGPNDHLKSCDFYKISTPPPYDAHTMFL